jgi:tyrosinase
MATTRRGHTKLSAADWRTLIDAIDAIRRKSAARPRYDDFVRVHVRAMSGNSMHEWAVHTMPMPGGMEMRGRNFLPWHRWFLLQFEQRLQAEQPGVTVPYWDWITNPKIPPQINQGKQLRRWRISRDWTADLMPDRSDVTSATKRARFEAFQARLESAHNWVHRAVGGEMNSASSPADPLFWLHHANIDRIWDRWQAAHTGARPKNASERLQPKALLGLEFDLKVSEVLSTGVLGYRYG